MSIFLTFLFTLFFIALILFLFNLRSSYIFLILSIELLLFILAFFSAYFSFLFDDLTGSLLTLLILPIAGIESALALSLLVIYYNIGTKVI